MFHHPMIILDHLFYGNCNLVFQNINIKLCRNNYSTSNEIETLPYCPASPERGSGVHRIVGIIVKNPNPQYKYSDRSLNIDELLSNSGEIISYNFFLTTWTKSVSNHFKSFNSKERIFGEFKVGPGQNNVQF